MSKYLKTKAKAEMSAAQVETATPTAPGLHDIVEAIPEETLTRQDIITRAQDLRDFRTPQCWGLLLSPFVYAYGSSALMNDDNQHRLLAIVTGQEGTLIGCHPLANIDGIADILGGFDRPKATTHDARCTLDRLHDGECNVNEWRG